MKMTDKMVDDAIEKLRVAFGVATIDDLVDVMAVRFLGWRLPEHFSPDAGITFKPAYNVGTPYPAKHEPTGTNLFSKDQAKEMVRHMIGKGDK